MPIDPSMEPMLDTFIYETTTLLDQLDQILLDSEKSKSFSSDSVNEVFRIMHTIKGSAAMMDTGRNFHPGTRRRRCVLHPSGRSQQTCPGWGSPV